MIVPRHFDWDDALIDAVKHDGLPRVHVYRPAEVSVVLGRGSRPEIEVNLEAVGRDGVALLKRHGGGCSVVLDTGNVIVSVALPLSGFGGIPRAFSAISGWMINALDRAGAPNVEQAGISDLVLGDRKIGGASIYRSRDLLYYSTTLLYRPNLELVERYLRHPPREPDYRRGRTHRAFMGSLAGLAAMDDVEALVRSIGSTLNDSLADLAVSLEHSEVFPNTTEEVLA